MVNATFGRARRWATFSAFGPVMTVNRPPANRHQMGTTRGWPSAAT